MKIQIITKSGMCNSITNKNKNISIEKSPLTSPRVFDDFDLNIISFQDSNIWRNDGPNHSTINSINDINTISKMLESTKSKIIIFWPSNIEFLYEKCSVGKDENSRYFYTIKIKDIINDVKAIICSMIRTRDTFECVFSKSNTIINNIKVDSDFIFEKINNKEDILTETEISKKTTSFLIKPNICFSTLFFENDTFPLMDFLNEFGYLEDIEEIPEWVKCYIFNNDKELLETKNEINKEKESIKIKESENNKLIQKNLYYKSIIYFNGEKLASIVNEIMGKLLQYDLSGFVDEKREDFQINNGGGITFIGEIKGVTSGVRSEYVSQLDCHVQSYNDELAEKGLEEEVKGLLVINYQRTKPLEERDPVNKKQIDLAIRNNSLIIPTDVLLKIYSDYLNKKIDTDYIIKLFAENVGLLTYKTR